MGVDPTIFKAYDIRGLAPEQLDDEVAFLVGQAIVKFTGARAVVVGQDMRATTPMLFESLAKGVMSQGADVIDIGQVTTPMFYFAVGHYDLHDAGVMITASHNPAKYNGLKLCFGDVLPIGGKNGMEDIKRIALEGPYESLPTGTVVQTDIKEDYLERLFGLVTPDEIGELKVEVDGGNGMEGAVLGDLFARLPQVTYEGMYMDPDGSFPNHEANPLKRETLADLQAKIKESGADLGFAFDGDGDRMGLLDDKGRVIPGDVLLAMMADRLLKRYPGEVITYTVNCSMIIPEVVERAGGRALMTPVGHGLIKPIMREAGALFGGEIAYHFYFRDMFTADSTDLMVLQVLKAVTEEGRPLSEIIEPYLKYHQSEEINSEVEDKDGMIAKLKEMYAADASRVVEIDGIRLEFLGGEDPNESWWFNVRASNTEPLLRLKLEAATEELLEEKQAELLAVIRG